MPENLYVLDSTGVLRGLRALEGPGGALIQVMVPASTSNRAIAAIPVDDVNPSTLAAARTNRRKVTIFNDSVQDLRWKLGDAAALTDCTDILEAGQTLELFDPCDDGIITCIWVGPDAAGFARVTEQW